jgi:hypothetical protein
MQNGGRRRRLKCGPDISDFVILSEARDLHLAANCGFLASLGMTRLSESFGEFPVFPAPLVVKFRL